MPTKTAPSNLPKKKPEPAATASRLSLATVSAKIDFISGWLADYSGNLIPPAAEEARMRELLAEVKDDLTAVVDRLLSTKHLGDGGQDPEAVGQTG